MTNKLHGTDFWTSGHSLLDFWTAQTSGLLDFWTAWAKLLIYYMPVWQQCDGDKHTRMLPITYISCMCIYIYIVYDIYIYAICVRCDYLVHNGAWQVRFAWCLGSIAMCLDHVMVPRVFQTMCVTVWRSLFWSPGQCAVSPQSLPLGCLLVNGQKYILMIFRTSGLLDFWTQSVPTQKVELVLLDVEGLGNPLLEIVAIYAVVGQEVIERGVNAHHLGFVYCWWAQHAWQAVQGGLGRPIRLKAHLALLSVEWGLIALDGPVPAICYVPPWDATHPPHCDAKWQCDPLTPVWGISILYRDYLRCGIHKK